MSDSTNLSPAVERPPHVSPDRVVDFDMYARPGSEGYHETWLALRRKGAPEIVWTPRNEGHWMVTSGRLVSQVFADYERFSASCVFVPKSTGQFHSLPPSTIDPPEHRHYRNLLTSGLSPKAVGHLEQNIRDLAIELIESFRSNGRCSFTTEFAEQLPIRIFMQIVDLPLEDAAKIKRLVDQVTRPDGSMPYEEVIQSLVGYMAPVARVRRGGGGADLITRMVNGKIGDRPLTEKEAAEISADVLLGGMDTVVNMMAFIMHHLASNEASRQRLIDDPGLIPTAVEEFLRRFPIIADGREVRKDIIFEGVEMKSGEMIIMPTVFHGLDERENDAPLAVDFDRPSFNHSTFGNGAHRCPGANLARVELRIMLEEWLQRIPQFSVDPDALLTYSAGVVGRIDFLPLVWETP